jgi:hypothetical protein
MSDFDDLIPKSGQGGDFDDLIPAGAKAKPKAKPANRGRQLAGRSVAQGVGGVLDMLGQGATMFPGSEPMRWVLNQLPSGRDVASAEMDARGFAKPETPSERIGVGVGEALTGTALTLGAGAASNARFLTANPMLQLTGAATGATASGVARENGASPVVQTLAGILGGLSPAGVAYSAPAAARGLVRGGEAGRQNILRTLADFRAAGTSPTVGQATGRWVMQGIESSLGKFPGSAGVIARRAKQQGEEIGAGVRATADELAPRADSESAGRAITRGVNGPGGFMERTGQVQERLYGRLDEHIDPATRVGVNNTTDVLAEVNPTIPGAPEISKNFQNARIGGLERAFESDARGVGGVLSRPDVREWADEMRTSLQMEADDIAAQNAQRRALMLPEFPVPTAAQIDEQVMGRVAAMADGRLPYEAVQKTRTLVGREIADGGIGADVPRSKWNPLYGGLSRDMKAAADEAGPQARQAWERANRYTRAKSGRQESIAHVVDKNGGPESIFRAATAGTKEGATTLRALMRSLPERSQKEVAAAVLNRMGRATSGKQNADGSEFSTQTFITNWNNLSPQARGALFDRFGPEFRSKVDAITRTADNLNNGSQVYANPAGTAAAMSQNVGIGALGTGTLAAMFGEPTLLMGAAGTMGGANLLARMMTRPRSAEWLGERTLVPRGAANPLPFVLSEQEREKREQDQRNARKDQKR